MQENTANPWNKRVRRLAGPIILSNVSVPLLGVVDTAVVGRLPGPEHIGAVAVGATIFNVVYWAFGFLRMGTTGFTAQALGRRDFDDVRNILGRAFVIAVVICLGLWLCQTPIKRLALGIIDASDAVTPLAERYYDIRIWAAPAALMNYALLGWFIGAEHTKAALISQAFLNGLNMILDAVFVLRFQWGVDGVALATVIAEYAGLGVGLLLMAVKSKSLGGRWRRSAWVEPAALKAMMAVNRDILIRTLCLQTAFVLFTAIGARLGDVQLAANAVLLLFHFVMAYGLDGFAFAAESLAGQAYGARRMGDFKAAARSATTFALVLSIVAAPIYWSLGPLVIDAITIEPQVRETARQYLIWVVVSPVVSVWPFMLDGIFIGCTRSSEMRNAAMMSLCFYLGFLVLAPPVLGNHGLWLALMGFMVVRALTLLVHYPKILDHFSDEASSRIGPGKQSSP